MSRVLLESGHSLLDQSLQATHIEWPTNGDGFGVGWYDRRTEPGLFRDVLPIWNDTNFAALADQIESPLFFAHVRRSTTGAIQRTNCHPFAHRGWMFQHNGSIPSFPQLKQGLYAQIAPELFPHLHGSTDSECMFLLAMSHGLRDDPPAALAAMIRIVESARLEAGLEAAFRCTSAVSDGETTWAVRYASHGEPRSLYYSSAADALCDPHAHRVQLPEGSVIVASEPLGGGGGAWREVAPSAVLTVSATGVCQAEIEL